MAVFNAAVIFGPCAGPIISGYISPALDWRWTFWIGLIFAGVSFVPVILVPETYTPVLLKQRARKLRKESQNENICAPMELEKADLKHVLSVVLMRPIKMFVSEPILFFSCLYSSFVYGILYMFFQAYPIIYIQTYGFSLGQEGLAFLAIGVGGSAATCLYLSWDNITRKARAQGKEWVKLEEMRRLPLACIAGPFFVAGWFWVGWTAKPSVPWIIPVLSGIPFGVGYFLIFISFINYLVDAYKIFAASAMASATLCRSIFAAALPFAARPMYKALGIPWACTLLGIISTVMCLIPFVFIWKGEAIRARSPFCQELIRKEIEAAEREQSARERQRSCEAQSNIKSAV